GHITVADDLDRSSSAETIRHELAHQWFGDLVTPMWWNDIWLNESFAAWMADKLGEHDLPARVRSNALAHLDPFPIVRDDISTTADLAFFAFVPHLRIQRGAALLHLLDGALGEDVVRSALRRYVGAHTDGLVSTADLIDAVAETTSAQVGEEM